MDLLSPGRSIFKFPIGRKICSRPAGHLKMPQQGMSQSGFPAHNSAGCETNVCPNLAGAFFKTPPGGSTHVPASVLGWAPLDMSRTREMGPP